MCKMLINNLDKTLIFSNLTVFFDQEIAIKYEHQG